MPTLSTHVLDTALGRPAAGVPVLLLDASGGGVADGVTDSLRFAVAGYQPDGFYPEVSVTFTVAAEESHYHVPLLLSPYGYSTYRGS